jgi:type I restriction enzyme R subunit
LEGCLRDPISQEIGKSIIFTVSQNHAAKLTQILNEMADRMYPGKYQSDFAIQVTSQITDAQQFTINFANNNLKGSANFLATYKTSKARVCVTVGMMTTGYDCEDILNIGLFRPIFSPSDFIQIKGRGTRKHNFTKRLFDDAMKGNIANPEKKVFKLFDFFANCEYFENEFNYDEVLKLPKPKSALPQKGGPEITPPSTGAMYEYQGQDILETMVEQQVGYEGMRIDRLYFQTFEDSVREDQRIATAVEAGRWDEVINLVNTEVFDKPNEYYSLEKLRKAADVDRKLGLKEILEKVFGLIPSFKSKDQLLEEEFAKFVADQNPDPELSKSLPAIKNYFKAYVTDQRLRKILESKELAQLSTNPSFTSKDYRAVPTEYRTLIPDYVRDYVTVSQFVA